MYFGDHLPPHFHAEYAEFTAQISIDNLGILQGYLPPKALALVIEWSLLENWKSLSEVGSGSFKKIEPLK